MERRCYVVAYDISSPKRWRKVYRVMMGFGEHIQLSVFRCDLTPEQRVRLRNRLDEEIDHREDQVILVEIGPSRLHGPRWSFPRDFLRGPIEALRSIALANP